MKKCLKCEILKEVAKFRKDMKGKGGLRGSCKDCERYSKEGNGKLLKKKTSREKLSDAEADLIKCLACNEIKTEAEYRKKGKRKCRVCMQNYERVRRRFLRENRKVLTPALEIADPHFEKRSSALNGFFNVFEYSNKISNLSGEEINERMVSTLSKVSKIIPVKVNLEVEFTMKNSSGVEFEISKKTNKLILTENNVQSVVDRHLAYLEVAIFDGYYEESGLSFVEVKKLRIHVNPFIVSTGGTYVNLPDKIKNTQACVNVQNKNDSRCFLWCIIAFFIRKDKKISNPSKLFNYKKPELIAMFNMTGISYPVSVCSVQTIEESNNLSINVYQLSEILNKNEGKNDVMYPISLIYPDRSHEDIHRKIIEGRHINLLLFKNHYVLITNIRKLFSSCNNGHHSAFVCEWCGTSILTSKNALDSHEVKCKFKLEHQKYYLPKALKVKFKNFQKQIPVPFIIYADFESYFEPSDKSDTCKTKYLKKHKAMGFGFRTVCRSDSKHDNEMQMYLGEAADKEFTKDLVNEIKRISKIVANSKSIIMTQEDTSNFAMALTCFICDKEFNGDKVRDHDHISGKYRGAAHEHCNLQFTKKCLVVPVVFHNLEGYDIHLFVDSLNKYGKEFNIIPKSKEKYLSLTMSLHDCKLKLRFIDSLHFLTGSLSDNANKLTSFRFISDEFKELRVKQYYPYSYFTSLDKLNETQLPSDKMDWYNELRKEYIKDDELAYAQDVFRKFNCRDLRDYTALYLRTDVNLLAEVFENFRDLAMRTYKLDPAAYFTTPGFAWDAALKSTEVELELLSDREMVDFFIEKGTMRGGISTVCRKKESIANHKYLDNFDSSKPSSFIMYFDVTNLYGFTMAGYLPTGDFRWLSSIELENYFQNTGDLFKLIDTGEGCILEVDLVYPTNLRDKHVELPLAPEHFEGKLTPNLFSKYNYRLRVENLKFYIDNGMILKKITRGMVFSQSKWLKKYIDKNTDLRRETSDEAARNFYKLMNNAVYGKTMENVFSRKNFKLVNKNGMDKIIKLTRSSLFKKEHILTENMVILEMEKTEIEFDKPIYIGFSILELSKLHMYGLHYDILKKKFGDNATLMYMDTDSLVYEVKCEDVYRDLTELEGVFDMSVYPKDCSWYSSELKGVLGTLKDEFASHGGRLSGISEFSCLRSKCYSMKTFSNEEVKKCKGVVKCEVNRLTHADFVECNNNGGIVQVTQTTFKTLNHNIYTVETTKDGLSRLDSKRDRDVELGVLFTVPWGYSKSHDEI